jgi:hypothetical protein
MVVRALERMAAAALLICVALPLPAQSLDIPVRRVDVSKFSCGEFSALQMGEERDRILIYMNGYLDGTRKATIWDAAQIGPRIDEVVRLCKEQPKLSVLEAFRRAWKR